MRKVLYNIFIIFILSLFVFGCTEFGSIRVAERVEQPIESLCREGTVLQTHKGTDKIINYICVKESEDCIAQEIENPRPECEKEGVYKSIYKNGQTRFLTTFKNNKINGKLERYTEDGFLYQKEYYKNNFRDGISQTWDTETKLIISYEEYSKGQKHGEARTYDILGKLSTKSFWIKGRLMQSNEFRYFNRNTVVENTKRNYNYFIEFPITVVEKTVYENGREISTSLYIE